MDVINTARMNTGFLFFLKELLLCDVSYIELFTRKILMFIVEWFYCPDGIIPDCALSRLNYINRWINIYIYIYVGKIVGYTKFSVLGKKKKKFWIQIKLPLEKVRILLLSPANYW